MTGMEIALLVIGGIFVIGSFFVSEKLSSSEINYIAKLSDSELKKIIGKRIENAKSQLDTVIDDKLDEAAERAEIVLERESNMKIMAVSEYSDTVMESMKKTHDEIMFLYSMLNDKHTEMTSLTGDLQRLAANVRNIQDKASIQPPAEKRRQPKHTELTNDNYLEKAAAAKEDDKEAVFEKKENRKSAGEDLNHNDRILALYKEGFDKVEIAKRLNLGVGEVSLVIGLYRGEEK